VQSQWATMRHPTGTPSNTVLAHSL